MQRLIEHSEWSMTGASPVTTIHGTAWRSRAVLVSIVVTGLAPCHALLNVPSINAS